MSREALLEEIKRYQEMRAQYSHTQPRAAFAVTLPVIALCLLQVLGVDSGSTRFANWKLAENAELSSFFLVNGSELSPISAWLIVFVAAALLYGVSAFRGKSRRDALESSVTRNAYITMIGVLLAAVPLTFRLLVIGNAGFIPGLWLMVYGLGVWSLRYVGGWPFRAAGVVFGIAGTIAALSPMLCDWMLYAGFGAGHLVLALALFVSRKPHAGGAR